MKFGQLIEYNMKNMKNHIQNVVETTPWPLSFVCQIEDYRNMSKPSCRPLAFTSFKVKKKKKGLELVSLVHFLHDFLRKIFLLLSSITCSNFIAWLPLLREILDNLFFVCWPGCDVCWPDCDVRNFEINLAFLFKPLFLNDQKVKTKLEISWERKELLRWNKKHFLSFLKSFHWSKWKFAPCRSREPSLFASLSLPLLLRISQLTKWT